MNGVLVPCLDCSELTHEPTQGRCEECAAERRRVKERGRTRTRDNRPDRTGPQAAAWRRLSVRARKSQPWCSDCHETRTQVEARGDRLEADHLPSAWHKHQEHKPLTLEDVEVVCGQCNIARGSSQPGSARYEEWSQNA